MILVQRASKVLIHSHNKNNTLNINNNNKNNTLNINISIANIESYIILRLNKNDHQ